MRFVVALIAGLVCFCAYAQTESIDAAKELYGKYVTMSDNFDPAIVDLYADDAVLIMRRKYLTGEVEEMALDSARIKSVLRQSMPLAKARGDKDTFSEETFNKVGRKVRITAMRYNHLKRFKVPHEILVGQVRDGSWKILEEIAITRP